MSAAQSVHHAASGRTLRVEEEPQRDVYWCHMHADAAPGQRPCFSLELVEDILDYQRSLGERLRRRADTSASAHLVLASDSNAFNLGGDLELFSRLIRSGDREGLLHYAHQCVRGAQGFHDGCGAGAHTIALVQGDALGGGFEAALSCHTIVAEEGVTMGLPEVLFDLFPGMGAWSFLCERIAPQQAEKLMLEGECYSSEQMHAMGLVDVLAPRGQGVAAVEKVIHANRRTPHARRAMQQVRELTRPALLEELMRITEIWVDTALQLEEKSLRTMDRLVRAQQRRAGAVAA